MSDGSGIVTDHAVVTYLERVYGVDVSALKRRIASTTADARETGASAVVSKGVKYCLSPNGNVTTVYGPSTKMTARGRRWKGRRK